MRVMGERPARLRPSSPTVCEGRGGEGRGARDEEWRTSDEEEEEDGWVAQLDSRPRDTETVETALAPRSLARSLPPCVVPPSVVPCVVGGRSHLPTPLDTRIHERVARDADRRGATAW